MKKTFYLIILFFLPYLPCKADIRLPSIISDNMVLQQDTIIYLWGKAEPQEKITIKPSWGKTYTTVTDNSGKWQIQLKTPKARNNQTISFRGNNTILIKNILIGEVWLCSGQSNMDFPVAKSQGWRTGILNQEEEMKDADYPEIRLFWVTQQLSPEKELEDCQGEWKVCNPENLKDFSAVAFFFGRELYKNIGRPIGLIQSTWGGTPAESWTKMSVMENDPVYAELIENFKQSENIHHNKALATLWNGMIRPIVPYSLKGVIWYQGESNSIRYRDYTKVFSNLIESWRTEWGLGAFPFYFVQIAPHYKQPPQIREAQLNVWRNIKNTGMAVITDAGDSTDIHPRNKQIPGYRLAQWALANTYGLNRPFSGPLYKSMEIKENAVLLTFDFIENGFVAQNGPLQGFTIAGSDGKFYPGEAIIKNNKIEVTSSNVPKPAAVRYGWGKFFRANLYNTAGLPASPFRTDTWEDRDTAIRFADSEMTRFPRAWQLDHGKKWVWGYAQGVGCTAMLKVWKRTNDPKYYNYVYQWADAMVREDGSIRNYKTTDYNIDFINSGKILFDIYKESGKEKFRMAMDTLLSQLDKHPQTSDGVFWHKKIYPHQIWLDGIYMAGPFMAQYGKEFNRPDLIDKAIHELIVTYNHTLHPATGLLYHAYDESRQQQWADKETGQSPHFWGRAIGWYYMALVDIPDFVPKDHPQRAEVISIIDRLTKAISNYQDTTGLWYQIIDMGGKEGNYLEASVSSMFMYSIAKAVNKRYIDSKYIDRAERAYRGLMNELIVEEPGGILSLTRCCAVAGLGGNPYRDGSYEYYINERIRNNDSKATGPFIMGCLELNK